MTAGENTTVYGVVSDVDVLNYAAGTNELFEVTGTVIARQGVPIALPGETASDDVQLEIPEVFNLEVRIDDPVGSDERGGGHDSQSFCPKQWEHRGSSFRNRCLRGLHIDYGRGSDL